MYGNDKRITEVIAKIPYVTDTVDVPADANGHYDSSVTVEDILDAISKDREARTVPLHGYAKHPLYIILTDDGLTSS
jgi:hypothetical protein